MRKCFFPQLIEIGEEVELDENNSRHLITVMRLHVGDKFVLCDRAGDDHEMEIVTDDLPQIRARSLSVTRFERELPLAITLYQGLPKGDKFDLIIRQTVELGIARIVPVLSDNCVAKLPADKQAKKLERWQRLAEAAAKQSGRNRITEISPAITVDQMKQELIKHHYAFICHEHEDQHSLKDWARQNLQDLTAITGKTLGFFIGPEGGISQRESSLLDDLSMVTLGRTILRTETAGTAVMAMLVYAIS